MQEKVEEYPLGSKLHLNAVLVWICGLRLWQNIDLEGSHISSCFMIWSTRGCVTFMDAEYSVVER